jgi:VWFA-related protein
MRPSLASLLAIAILVPEGQTAQKPFRSVGHGVRIDVLVSDGGRPVEGLTAADFELTDTGVPQQVNSAVVAGHVAVSVVLDTSLSVRVPGFEKTISTCMELLRALQAPDRVALISFSDRVSVVVPTTGDLDLVRRGLESTRRFGAGVLLRSTVWDAVFAGASLVAEGSGRPLVLLVSDGMDNASGLSKDSLAQTLSRLAITVDMMRVPWDRGSFDEFGPGRQVPEEFIEATGGVASDITKSSVVRDFGNRLETLRRTYLLTYTPTGVKTDDGWHNVKVSVRGRRLSIKARPGYFASRQLATHN